MHINIFLLILISVFNIGKLSFAQTNNLLDSSFVTSAPYAFLIDYKTKTILVDKQADELMAPSSMSKLMTIYLAFMHLKQEKIKLSDELTVSKKAWAMGGSKMFLDYNSMVKIEDLLKSIIIQSGNDSCVALAEGLSGDESIFVHHMNETAKKIGLTKSTFKNSTGWPDDGHLMTAREIAEVSIALIRDFPEYYHYFAEKEFTYNNIKQYNRNTLLNKGGVDGLKTGHTDIAGYGIAISAERNGRRMVAVINGLTTQKERAIEAERILSYGFNNFTDITLYKAGEKIATTDVWYGSQPTVDLIVPEAVEILIPKFIDPKQIQHKLSFTTPIPSPILKGQILGELVISIDQTIIKKLPVVAATDINEGSMLNRMKQNITYFLRNFSKYIVSPAV